MILDFVLTLLIFYVSLSLFIFISSWFIESVIDIRLFTRNPYGIWSGLIFDTLFYSPFIYTTLFTSVWIYLYLISLWIMKIGLLLRKGTGRVFGILDVERKPFLSLGIVSSTYIFVTGIILSLII